MIHRKVWLLDSKGTRIQSLAQLYDGAITLIINDACVTQISGAGGDYFESLIKIRENLEARDWKILCNGARVDVYPSRMSRQMSMGLKAYTLKLGVQASLRDLVDILDEAELEKIGTIVEQINNYRLWVSSLGE